MEKRLRTRKKQPQPQSDEERWQSIYSILFPEDKREISPCKEWLKSTIQYQSTNSLLDFEPVQDEAARPRPAPETSLGEYLRLESPQIFSRIVQNYVQSDAQDPYVVTLVAMMTRALDTANTNYKNRALSQSLEQTMLISPPSSDDPENNQQWPNIRTSPNQTPTIAITPSQPTPITMGTGDPGQFTDHVAMEGLERLASHSYMQQQGMGTNERGKNPASTTHGSVGSPSSPLSIIYGLSLYHHPHSAAASHGPNLCLFDGNGGTNTSNPEVLYSINQALTDITGDIGDIGDNGDNGELDADYFEQWNTRQSNPIKKQNLYIDI